MPDLFGPIRVKNFVNPRTSRKTWGVVITCLTTRACQVYLAESFSTDHLLCVLNKHEARNGSPAEYFADLGRQIVGADRVLAEGVEKLDTKLIERVAASREVKFNFGTGNLGGRVLVFISPGFPMAAFRSFFRVIDFGNFVVDGSGLKQKCKVVVTDLQLYHFAGN